MINSSKKARLKWQCRRGMRELDLILSPFAENHLDEMTEKQVDAFAKLLAYSDPELFSWFMGHSRPEDLELADLVQFISLQH